MAEQEKLSIEVIQKKVPAIMTWATSLVIKTKEDADVVAEKAKEVKGWRAWWVGFNEPLKKKSYDLWKGHVAQEKVGLDIIDPALKLMSDKVGKWEADEREKAAAEQRRLQALADEKARKEREVAEQAAAKQRAIEEEQRRKADEARKAAETASAAEKARLQAVADAADRKANAAAAKAEEKQEVAASVISTQVNVEARTAEGASTRMLWKAFLKDKNALIAAATPGSPAASLLEFNQSEANTFATGTKGKVVVPGVEFRHVPSTSFR